MDVKSLIIIVVVLAAGLILVYEVGVVFLGQPGSQEVAPGAGNARQGTPTPVAYATPPAYVNASPVVDGGVARLYGTVQLGGVPVKTYTQIEEFRYDSTAKAVMRFITGYTEGIGELYALESPVTDQYSYAAKAKLGGDGHYEVNLPIGKPVYVAILYVKESRVENNYYSSVPERDTIVYYYGKTDPFVVYGDTRMDINLARVTGA